MKTTWKIIRSDFRRLTSNIATMVIVIGLVVVPGIFAWFNIAASWDPFANTKNLTFAVANDDECYESPLIPAKVCVGEQVVNALRANDQLDWAFTSEEEAIDGTKEGRYYAAVVIPKEFSLDMMTFFSPSMRHGELDYYTNEKLNALAPKVTGQGADEVSAQINTLFTSTITEIALRLASTMADTMLSPTSHDALTNFATHISDTGTTLRNASTTLGTYDALLASAQSLMDSSNDLLSSTSQTARHTRDTLRDTLSGTDEVSDAASQTLQALKEAMSESEESFTQVSKAIDSTFENASKSAQDVATIMDHQGDIVERTSEPYRRLYDSVSSLLGENSSLARQLKSVITRIDSLATRLHTQAQSLRDTSEEAQTDHEESVRLAQEAASHVHEVSNHISSDLSPALTHITSELTDARTSLIAGGSELSSALSSVFTRGEDSQHALSDARSALSSLRSHVDEAALSLTNFSDSIREALASGDLEKVKKVIGSDPSSRAASLAAPVELSRSAVYPVENFGASLTPFYSFLPLWVGSLLLAVTLKTRLSKGEKEEIGVEHISPHTVFFGRYAVFAFLALLQATFSLAGTLLFLRVHASHPWLFMLTGWASALVFSFLVYTLVACFGNIGKAIGVILLVIQISAAGGAYPLGLLPSFMTKLNPYLPVTHSIQMLRAAIAGIYQGDYWHHMLLLFAFVPPMLLFAVVMARPMERFNHWYQAKIEKTKVIA